ncbi:MAG: VOC family protein [Rhodospirillaceae bacterium]|nr:VOC family protein [Rhodospirillaceae bacterium]
MAAKKRRAAKAKTKAKRKARKGKVPPIPKGAHTVTAYITVGNCVDALAFYVKAFGAKETFRLTDPTGRIGHAQIKIGDSAIMMSDPFPEWGTVAPSGPEPMRLHLAVKNTDAFVAKAVAAGAKVVRPVEDQFYGFRAATLMDPFGHSWGVSHQIEKVSPKQMQKRWNAMMAGMKKD